MQRIDPDEIQRIMAEADIQTVLVASGSSKNSIETLPIPNTQNDETVFGVASLSKPVFTYLILKLISAGYLALDTKLDDASQGDKKILPFADFCKNDGINWIESPDNIENAKQFTPHLILSHQTGLPIRYNYEPKPEYDNKPAPLQFDFVPNKGFGYSGIHLKYLQRWVELKTGRKLNDLAKEFVFSPAGMSSNTTFGESEAHAANSLRTTARDYICFCLHWINDKDPLAQEAFNIQASLVNDPWAVKENISPTTLHHLAWGYGWGLETDGFGKVIGAYHTGDMNEWRSGIHIDLLTRNATVFLSKSTAENGHLLQEKIFGQSHFLDYFYDKFKFARTTDELKDDWRENPSYGIRKNTIQASSHSTPETTIVSQQYNPFTQKR